MKAPDKKYFHRLYGVKKPRIAYNKKDFFDYLLMTTIVAGLIYLAYGSESIMSKFGFALCGFMVVSFIVRHGFEISVPLILRRPQDFLYMIIYKVQNIKPVYIFAVSFLALENFLIYLTPAWPHNVELMRTIAIYLFYTHFAVIFVYRLIILLDHLRKRELVREVLLQTPWKGYISRQKSISWEILHAYFTGLLTHITWLSPWYIIITHSNFSIVFLPLALVVNVLVQYKFLKVFNIWFYRDHWLGHNSEIEFVHLHGTHHDAIPSGLIGVSGNGYLEGFLRQLSGVVTLHFNPIVAFIMYTFEVQRDIALHQYIPGIFPKAVRDSHEMNQHSTHHYRYLEPYSIASKLDQPHISEGCKEGNKVFPYEFNNSFMLDEQLTGFKWDNPGYRNFIELFDKYQK